jgi:hypothetical protein
VGLPLSCNRAYVGFGLSRAYRNKRHFLVVENDAELPETLFLLAIDDDKGRAAASTPCATV